MKIAFPTQKDSGFESLVFDHFGSAPLFIIVDSLTSDIETVSNLNLNHSHGNCRPREALGGKEVDAVVVGGIGKGALMKLNADGITAFKAVEGSVSLNLNLIKSRKLPVFTMNQTCMGHQTDGHCAH